MAAAKKAVEVTADVIEQALRAIAEGEGFDSIEIEFSRPPFGTGELTVKLVLPDEEKPKVIGSGATLTAAVQEALDRSHIAATEALEEAEGNAVDCRKEISDLESLIRTLDTGKE